MLKKVNIYKIFTFLTLFFINFYSISCGGGSSDSSNIYAEEDLIQSYKVKLQENINAYAIETSLNDEEIIISNTGEIILSIPKANSIQYIMVNDKYANTILLYPVFPDTNNSEIHISSKSTADALISLTPQIYVLNNAEVIKQIITSVHNTPEYEELVNTIESYLQKDSFDKDFFKESSIIESLDKVLKKIVFNSNKIATTSTSLNSEYNRKRESNIKVLGINDILFEISSNNDNINIRNPYFVAYGFFPKEEAGPYKVPFEFIKSTNSFVSVDLKLWPPKIEFKDGYSNIVETEIPLKLLPDKNSNYPIYIQRNFWTRAYDLMNGLLLLMELTTTVDNLTSKSQVKLSNLLKDQAIYNSLLSLMEDLKNVKDIQEKAKYLYLQAKGFSYLIDNLIIFYNKNSENGVSYEVYKTLKYVKNSLDAFVFFMDKFGFKYLGIKDLSKLSVDIRALLIDEVGKSLDEIYKLPQEDVIKLISNFYNNKFAKNERFLKMWLVFNNSNTVGNNDGIIKSSIDGVIVGLNFINAFYEWAKEDAKILDRILNEILNKKLASKIKERTLSYLMKISAKIGTSQIAYTGYVTNKVAPFVWDYFTAPEKINAYYYEGRIISTIPPTIENIRYLRDGTFSLEDTGGKIILKTIPTDFAITGNVTAQGSFEFIHKNSESMWLDLPERDVFGLRVYKKYKDNQDNVHSELVYSYRVSIYNPFIGKEKVKVEEYKSTIGDNIVEHSVDEYQKITNGLLDTKLFSASVSFSREETPIGVLILYWNADSSVIKKKFIPVEVKKDISIEIIDSSECGRVYFYVNSNAPLNELQYEVSYISTNGNIENERGYLLSNTSNPNNNIKILLSNYGFVLEYEKDYITDEISLTLRDNYGNSETVQIPLPEECYEIPTMPIINYINISNVDECKNTGYCKFEVSIKENLTDFFINFGDGHQLLGNKLFSDKIYQEKGSYKLVLDHKYQKKGNYEVVLRVCNNDLCNEKSLNIDISAIDPFEKLIAYFTFENSFENSIVDDNYNMLIWENSDLSLIENGYLRLVNEYDNDEKRFNRLIINTANISKLIIEKKTKLLPKDNYFIGSTSVEDSSGNIVSIIYNGYHYNNGDLYHTILVENTEHFYILNRWNYVDANNFEYKISSLIDPVWNEWFYERITIDYAVNEVRYDISKDGNVYRTVSISSIKLTNDTNTKLTFSTFDWASSSEHLIDYVKIYKIWYSVQ